MYLRWYMLAKTQNKSYFLLKLLLKGTHVYDNHAQRFD